MNTEKIRGAMLSRLAKYHHVLSKDFKGGYLAALHDMEVAAREVQQEQEKISG